MNSLQRGAAAMKDMADRAMDAHDTTIFTTAMLLGCDMRSDDALKPTLYRFRLPDTNDWSDYYRSKVTCADMFLSQIGVYVDPQGVVYLPPNLKG